MTTATSITLSSDCETLITDVTEPFTAADISSQDSEVEILAQDHQSASDNLIGETFKDPKNQADLIISNRLDDIIRDHRSNIDKHLPENLKDTVQKEIDQLEVLISTTFAMTRVEKAMMESAHEMGNYVTAQVQAAVHGVISKQIDDLSESIDSMRECRHTHQIASNFFHTTVSTSLMFGAAIAIQASSPISAIIGVGFVGMVALETAWIYGIEPLLCDHS
jgi:3-oxoacyl-(acyl-carrier-protein) synthase